MKMTSRQSSKRLQQLSLARGKRKISDVLPCEMPSVSASERKLSMGSQSINKDEAHATQQWAAYLAMLFYSVVIFHVNCYKQ